MDDFAASLRDANGVGGDTGSGGSAQSGATDRLSERQSFGMQIPAGLIDHFLLSKPQATHF